jgi:outer membrane lipoprotein-sorting protein
VIRFHHNLYAPGVNVKKLFLMITFFIVCCHNLHAEVPDFRRIIEDFLSVNTIKASITQHVFMPGGVTETYSGDYIAAAKGNIRIDYIRPERQTVVINGTGLYWYYCDRRLVFFTEKNNNGMDSIPVFINSIPEKKLKNIEIKFLGIKFYSFFKKAEVYAIYTGTDSTRLILWIDPASKLVIRKYILDDSGREIIKEDYTEHVNIKGISIPSRIEFRARTADGIIHTITEYRDIVINTPVDMALFRFRITPEMTVRILHDKK